jgi:hypothetical protein
MIKVGRGIVFIYPFITYHVTRQPVPVHESALKPIAFPPRRIALRVPSSVSFYTTPLFTYLVTHRPCTLTIIARLLPSILHCNPS